MGPGSSRNLDFNQVVISANAHTVSNVRTDLWNIELPLFLPAVALDDHH